MIQCAVYQASTFQQSAEDALVNNASSSEPFGAENPAAAQYLRSGKLPSTLVPRNRVSSARKRAAIARLEHFPLVRPY